MIFSEHCTAAIPRASHIRKIRFLLYDNTMQLSCLGSLGRNLNRSRNRFNVTHDNQHPTNILGPKHFIVEEENEALLAKELQDAKLQSTHNSHSSMHSSNQSQSFHVESNHFPMAMSHVMKFLLLEWLLYFIHCLFACH
jgi:G3E family GTPase